MTRISVVMAVHNGERYLRQAVESILNQTYLDLEFIILDDGSSDSTPSILDEYAARDRRMVLVRNEANIGLARSLNRGLELAQSEYIARMDADDISLPGRLAAQVAFLDAHPDVGVLGTAACIINPLGNLGQEIKFPIDHALLRWRLCFFENPIIHPTVMMRKADVLKVNGYNPNLDTSQDHNLWCRLSGVTRLANLFDVYLYLRKHENGISSRKAAEQQKRGLENSGQLMESIIYEDISLASLERACHAVWSPYEANSQDYYHLAQLKYRLGKVLLTDTDTNQWEKEAIAKTLLGELEKLFSHIQGNKDRKEFHYWIQNIQVIISRYKIKGTAQIGNRMDNMISFHCPDHNSPLHKESDSYHCEQGCTYPVIDNIPRFVSTNNYAKAFGAQWKSYQRTQLDSYTGKPISRDRLARLVGGDLDILSNQWVLEAGCGAGRFTEILLQSGARVLATDLSDAVEANYGNCQHYENYAVIQADLLILPVAPEQFDVVICIGVIQHTPSPEKTIEALCGYVKPGGLLVIDHYSYNYPFTASRKFLRNVLIKTRPSFSISFCRFLVAVLWPIHRLLWKYRNHSTLGKLRSRFIRWSPVVDYHDSYAELGPELLYAWAMLDTHDTLTDYYKHFRSAEEIEAALYAAGMVAIETAYAGNGVEALARKPSLTG